MNYQTFEPSQELTTLIKCYWTLESPKEENPQRQTIISDGCMEMIFHYGDLYKQYLENGDSIIQPRCFVIGQLTQPLEIEPTGETGIFSIRFHPEGFLPLATIPIKEMENTAVSLKKLFGKDGEELEEKILTTSSVADRIKHIETFLLNRLADSETIDRIIKSTVETILTANGQLSIDELSKQTNINRRQLERKFSSTIGLSPKQLSKTIRLQATLKMLLNKEFTSLTALAYEGEYYDQAHFIKDFKEFTGLTPKEFYGNSFKMTSFFITD
ncbi:helix-turn-helix domain-containing protein [Pedobacter frigiditerrae]|uniref:helix-turn-helix domain-containing protein n=1 Tax=Pedobacter frigiditerrae TaxID=2530452 RepID=UPI00292EC2A8|nr:helix-turn-helix domain-containing protein [Pedobacter frigiditerrae]